MRQVWTLLFCLFFFRTVESWGYVASYPNTRQISLFESPNFNTPKTQNFVQVPQGVTPRGLAFSPVDGSLYVVSSEGYVLNYGRGNVTVNKVYNNSYPALDSVVVTPTGRLFVSSDSAVFEIKSPTDSNFLICGAGNDNGRAPLNTDGNFLYVSCSNLTMGWIEQYTLDGLFQQVIFTYSGTSPLLDIAFSSMNAYVTSPFQVQKSNVGTSFQFSILQNIPQMTNSISLTPVDTALITFASASNPRVTQVQLSPNYASEDAGNGAFIHDLQVFVECPGQPICSNEGSCVYTNILAPTCQCSATRSGLNCSTPVGPPDTGRSSKKSPILFIIIGVVVGSVLLICCVIVIIMLPKGNKKKPTEEEPLQAVKRPQANLPRSPSTLMLQDELAGWTVDYKTIEVKSKLGSGAFGIVYLAQWRESECAVKQLLLDQTDPKTVKDFLREVGTMRNIRPHPHVVGMLGVCVDPEYPLCIITDYMPDGSLDAILANPKHIIDFPQAIVLSIEIASGMAHLHAEKILHCDLSARNILCRIEKDKIFARVSDFGLSRVLEGTEYNAKAEHKFPVKWSSPEVILNGRFTAANDVWSFGIVLYEIFSRRLPYVGMSNKQVIEEVCDKGYRLPKPNATFEYPDEVYTIMLDCWNLNPEKRPVFTTLCQKLRMLNPNLAESQDLPTLTKSTHSKVYDPDALTPDGTGQSAYNGMELKDDDESYRDRNEILNASTRQQPNQVKGSMRNLPPPPPEDNYNTLDRDGENYNTFSNKHVSAEDNYNA